MTSRSDSSEPILVYEDATPAEPPAHRFFIGGTEVLRAFESGNVAVQAQSEDHVREIFAAFQFLDQAEFGGEH
jgi:outer membrane protein assembly factor BamA